MQFTMKHLLFALVTACLLAGCTPKSTTPADGTAVDSTAAVDSLQKVFLAVSQGVWVMNDYIADIEKTRSPLHSADKLEGVVAMIVNGEVKGDSLEIPVSWTNHEGTSFMLYFRPGQQAQHWPTDLHDTEQTGDSYAVGHATANGATQLSLYHYDKSHALLDTRAFTKVADAAPDNDVSWGLQTIVNETLIAGTYAVHDSSKTVGTITFNRDGSCTGYGKYKSYYVFTDFLGGPVPNFDEIAFNLGGDDDKRFAIDIKADTIRLNNMVGVEEDGTLKADKVRLTLVRK